MKSSIISIKKIRQRDVYENGITCLAIIFQYFGFPNLRNQLRVFTNASCSFSTDLFSIKNTAEELGFKAEAFQATEEALPYLDCPFIAHYKEKHLSRYAFVVVYHIGKKNIRYIHPAHGKIKSSIEHFIAHWDGILMTISKTKKALNNFESKKLFQLSAKYKKRNSQFIKNYYLTQNDIRIKPSIKDQLYDILIVGGGPSGLACGFEAKKSGLKWIILEKGKALNSLRDYPSNMEFVSPKEDLEINQIPFQVQKKKITTNELVNYYDKVAAQHALNLQCNQEVKSIKKINGHFLIITQDQNYLATNVIFANGFKESKKLNIPNLKDKNITYSYQQAYNYAHKYKNKKVAIIGGGISAVSLAERLYKQGASVTIIHRKPSFKWTVETSKSALFPQLDDLIENNQIRVKLESKLINIKGNNLVIEYNNNQIEEIYADHIFAMIGRNPDQQLLNHTGIEMEEHCGLPKYNPATLETSTTGIFVVGSTIGEIVFRTIPDHVNRIFKELKKRYLILKTE